VKVVYIANHGQNNADDEGAVTHALRELGHEVVQVMEGVASETGLRDHHGRGFDLLLFHKWNDPAVLRAWAGNCPRAFWYFDLVDWPADPTLTRRCAVRKQWMADVIPHVEFGFCTDGDWVTRDLTGKLIWLPQGADGRVVGRGKESGWGRTKLLFVGGVENCGTERRRFVSALRDRYGANFRHVERRCYREALKTAVAEADVVVCPWSPVTDRYWSNRVYQMAGFGGFVLHKSSDGLHRHYRANEVISYLDDKDLFDLIGGYAVDGRREVREHVSALGLERTKMEHLYRHRVERLLQEVARG